MFFYLQVGTYKLLALDLNFFFYNTDIYNYKKTLAKLHNIQFFTFLFSSKIFLNVSCGFCFPAIMLFRSI